VPDGGYYYRNFNPAALNLFFVVFRADVLRKAWQKKEKWAQIHFVAEFGEEVFRQIPKLDLGRVNWGKSEPYYPLFWSILSDGGKFLYLTEELYKPRYSSRVRTPSGLIVAEHMWYLREWFSHETMTGHDCPNFMRFANWESEWRLKHGASVKLRAMLGIMRIKRIARRLLR
jgi:hypothetical protein